jgi:hypothetical protein
MHDLARFLEVLEEGPSQFPHVFNPWRDADERDRSPRKAPRARLENVRAYVDARRRSACASGSKPRAWGCART